MNAIKTTVSMNGESEKVILRRGDLIEVHTADDKIERGVIVALHADCYEFRVEKLTYWREDWDANTNPQKVTVASAYYASYGYEEGVWEFKAVNRGRKWIVNR